jgi:hypothetical protein
VGSIENLFGCLPNGTPPFERHDSTLRLAENAGLGTRDVRNIEVVGAPIRESVFDFRRHDPR